MRRVLACAVAMTFVTMGVPQAAHAAPAEGSWAALDDAYNAFGFTMNGAVMTKVNGKTTNNPKCPTGLVTYLVKFKSVSAKGGTYKAVMPKNKTTGTNVKITLSASFSSATKGKATLTVKDKKNNACSTKNKFTLGSSESDPPSDSIGRPRPSAAKPKNGTYSGEIANSTTDPIYFSVAKSTLSGLIGSAPTRPNNCPKKVGAFALPSGDVKIKNGRFHESSSSYPYGATVGIKGSFTSAKAAKGKITVSFKNKNKPCSDKVPFTATWVKPSGGGTTP